MTRLGTFWHVSLDCVAHTDAPQEPEPEEEEEEEYDQELKEEFVVSQSDAGGSDRKVELKVIPTGKCC